MPHLPSVFVIAGLALVAYYLLSRGSGGVVPNGSAETQLQLDKSYQGPFSGYENGHGAVGYQQGLVGANGLAAWPGPDVLYGGH